MVTSTTTGARILPGCDVPDVLGDRVVCACGGVAHVPEFFEDGTLLCPDDSGGTQTEDMP